MQIHTKETFKFLDIFTTKKHIDANFLNVIGLQVFRYILSKSSYFLSGFFYSNARSIDKDYEEKGVKVYKNFLDQHYFEKIKIEFKSIVETDKLARSAYKKNEDLENSSIEYILYEFEDNIENKNKYPNLYNLYKDKKINLLFQSAEKKNKVMLFMRLERVITKDNQKNDRNAYWHVDTFHNTHKAWIYLDDVTKESGPFNYILGSNVFSFKRCFWEYLNSIKPLFKKNFVPYFLDNKFSNFLENNKVEMICEKNSFMIANTHGYHRRGDASVSNVRDAISFFTRENPFKIV